MRNKPLEDWKWKKLGQITECLDSKRVPVTKNQREKGDVPYYGANGIQGYVKEFIFDEELLLLAEDGGSWGQNQKCTYIIRDKSWVNNHAHVLRMRSGMLIKFLEAYLNLTDLTKYISGTTRGKLNQKQMNNIEIPVPPLPIQQKIVSILERAEGLKQKREQANEEANKIIQSIFYKMFGENKYPNEEILKNVEEVASRDPAKKPDDLFKYVDIAGIDNQTGQIKEFKEIVGKEAPSRARREIRENDIIVSTVRPNLNATAMIPKILDNQIASTGFCIIRCKKTLNSKYLFTITRQKKFIDELVAKMKGASYPAVTNNDVLKVKIPVPPLSFQNQFASIVEKIESIKQKQSKATSEINTLFDALMQKAFKGELIK